jgi:hypothetical protein
MSQTARKPDVGIGYKSTYKDKSGAEQSYLSVMLREEQLSQLVAQNGMIRLSIFPNLGEKKNPKAPDVVVKAALTKGTSSKGSSHASAPTGNKFPF